MRKNDNITNEYQETVDQMIRTERIDKSNAKFEKTEGGFVFRLPVVPVTGSALICRE